MCQMTFEKPALCAGLAKGITRFFEGRLLVYARAGLIMTPQSEKSILGVGFRVCVLT